MGVGVSMCPMLGSSGQGEIRREFLMLFCLFVFAETGVGFSRYKGSYIHQGVLILLCSSLLLTFCVTVCSIIV